MRGARGVDEGEIRLRHAEGLPLDAVASEFAARRGVVGEHEELRLRAAEVVGKRDGGVERSIRRLAGPLRKQLANFRRGGDGAAEDAGLGSGEDEADGEELAGF